MTVGTEACHIELAYTGVEVTFPAGFAAKSTADVTVTYLSAAGALSTLVPGVNVNVALDPTTLAVTVSAIAMPAAPGTVIIDRVTPGTQQTAFANLGGFSAAVHEDLHDRAAMRSDEAKYRINRAILLPTGEVAASGWPALAVRQGGGKGTFCGFDGFGNPTVYTNGSNAIAQSFPNNTVLMNISGGTGPASGGAPSNFATFLASANPNAPAIDLRNSADVSAAATFGTPQFLLITSQSRGRNGLVSIMVQDVSGLVTPSNPCATTAYGVLSAAGTKNAVWGDFARVDILAADGVGVHELNVGNTVADPAATFPPNLAIPCTGAWPIGLQVVNIGPKKGHTAFRAVCTDQLSPGTKAPWLCHFYADPPPVAGNLYGVFIDAGSSFGPSVAAALLRTSGNAPNLFMQTMAGATPANPIVQHGNVGASTMSFMVTQAGYIMSNGNTSLASTSFPAGNPNFYGIAADGNNASLILESYQNAGAFASGIVLRNAAGTGGAPSNLGTGSLVGFIGAAPRAGGAFAANPARLDFIYTDAGANNGMAVACNTTPNGGARAEAWRAQPSGGFSVGTTTDPGIGAILANTDLYSNNASFLIRTKTTQSNAAAAQTATLTNAPVAGNPTKWISIDDNGTTRRIPAW